MAELTAKWKKLSSSPILERSSHTVTVIGDKVYIFDGELHPWEPRTSKDGRALFRFFYSTSPQCLSNLSRSGLLIRTYPSRSNSQSCSLDLALHFQFSACPCRIGIDNTSRENLPVFWTRRPCYGLLRRKGLLLGSKS